jgi:hypothetical protein
VKRAITVFFVYVFTVLATIALRGQRVLPLFEGVGPPTAYRWVHPPSQFAASNVKPAGASYIITLGGSLNGAALVQTSDAQFLVNLAPGSFPAHGTDKAVHAAVTPLDPSTLPRPPAGYAADGNAYRITFTYQPSDTPLAAVAVAGNVVMTGPHRAITILFSADAHGWTPIATQVVSPLTSAAASFTRPGWYLIATLPSAIGSTGAGRSNGTLIVAAIIAAAAFLLGVVAIVQGRRRTATRGVGRRANTSGSGRYPDA